MFVATHRITINPLDTNSIANAVRRIEEFQKEFDKKLDEYFDKLADLGRTTAQGLFGSATTVSVEKTATGRKIVAHGTDEAYFVEFGTGVHAGTTSGLYAEFNSEIQPGAYSESDKGKHTWSAWIKAGNSEQDYPYNSAPKSPMYKAYEAICQNADSIARSVFG